MRRIAVLLAAVTFIPFLSFGCGSVKSDKEKTGYAIGQDIGNNLLKFKEVLDVSAVKLGIDDAMKGKKSRLTPEELQATMQKFQQYLMSQQTGMSSADAGKNLTDGRDFLAENAKKQGVKTTPSGLQYKIVRAGKGASPKSSDRVKVHYRGTLLNGKEFDSSYKRNEPAVFPLNGVIPGWTEGLQLMKVGGKAMLYVPPNLGYGERGMGGNIPPNSTLVFEVELLGIEK